MTERGAANKTECFLIPYDVGINEEGEPFECKKDEFSPPGSDKEGFRSVFLLPIAFGVAL